MAKLLFKHGGLSFYSDNRWVSEVYETNSINQKLNSSLKVTSHGAWCVNKGVTKMISSGGMPMHVPDGVQSSYELYIARLVTEDEQ